MTTEQDSQRQDLKGIQAVVADVQALRPIFRKRTAETKHKQKEIDLNYRRLLERQERFAQTGK